MSRLLRAKPTHATDAEWRLLCAKLDTLARASAVIDVVARRRVTVMLKDERRRRRISRERAAEAVVKLVCLREGL